MFRPFLLGLVATLGLSATASAQTVPHKESSAGQLTNVTATQMDWVAAGTGTHIGAYTEVGSHLYFPDGSLYGVFTVTAADGSTVSGTYEGTFAPIGGGLFQFEVDVYWEEGTGRLEGVTGVGTATAILDGATGKIVVQAGGLWSQP
jgi:hypothetical protein